MSREQMGTKSTTGKVSCKLDGFYGGQVDIVSSHHQAWSSRYVASSGMKWRLRRTERCGEVMSRSVSLTRVEPNDQRPKIGSKLVTA